MFALALSPRTRMPNGLTCVLGVRVYRSRQESGDGGFWITKLRYDGISTKFKLIVVVKRQCNTIDIDIEALH
jgi:hypothetical protein